MALFGFVVSKDEGDWSMGTALEASRQEAGDAVREMVEGLLLVEDLAWEGRKATSSSERKLERKTVKRWGNFDGGGRS